MHPCTVFAHNGLMTSNDSSDENTAKPARADPTPLGHQPVSNGETVSTNTPPRPSANDQIMASLGGEGDPLPRGISAVGSKTVHLAREMITRLPADVAGNIAFLAKGLPPEALSLDNEERSFFEPRAKLLDAALTFLINPASPQPQSKKQAKKEEDEAANLNNILVVKVHAVKADLVRQHPDHANKIELMAAQFHRENGAKHANIGVTSRPKLTAEEKVLRDFDRIAEALMRANLRELADRTRELQRAVKSAGGLSDAK